MVRRKSPKDLTDGCRYVLSAGGKRIRSTLVLLSCEAVGGTAEQALDAGASVEIMHNFTLVHDDIMDNADSRRGRPTVHRRWNVNNALLIGDVLLGLAYRNLLNTRSALIGSIVDVFTTGLLEVCEGQALDLEFGRRSDVLLPEYFRMIEKKTARLLSMAAEIGALIGNAKDRQTEALRRYGHFLGRAFQLQDDLLDVVADQRNFGKSIGGDIIEGKKTFLLLKAAERARGKDKTVLESILRRDDPGINTLVRRRSGHKVSDPQKRTIATVTRIYKRYGVIEEVQDLIRQNTRKATAALAMLPQSNAKGMLHWLSELLVDRVS